MKKTAILIAMMMVVISVTFGVTGCSNGEEETKATEASATPIATVAPTQKPTTAPTAPTATQPSTVPAATTPTQAATFNTQVATGTMPATVPSGTETSETETPTVSQYASSSLGTPNESGGYTLVGTVTGYGSSTVVIMLADGSEYEFNYVNSGVSTDSLYDGATVTVVSDGDPTGDAVPNAVQMIVS